VPLLEMQTDDAPAIYSFDSIDLKQFSVPVGTVVQKYNKVYEGKIPKRLALCFLSQDAFSGSTTRSPYLTENLDVREITLFLNGVAIRQLEAEFPRDLHADVFTDFINWMGGGDRDHVIGYDTYKQGYSFFCIDLLQYCNASRKNACGEEVFTQGFIDIGVKLGDPSEVHGVMCVFAEGSEVLELNKARAARYVKAIQ
jgi:hypothetical protein